jgi:uncharacterized protein
MIILDANILIYAVNEDAPLHSRANHWLESALADSETIGIPWMVLLTFIRLATRPGLFPRPIPLNEAFDLMDTWFAHPSATIVGPGPRHRTILRDLLSAAGTGGNLTSDAHLAALAIEHRAEVCSFDHDFKRFPGLKWRNPLA